MKILKIQNIKDILNGANFLSTGGGGTLSEAFKLQENFNRITKLVNFTELNPSSTVCTVYGIGGKQDCNPLKATKKALDLFEKVMNKNIDALIPVEIGPVSVATCIYLAGKLKIPVINSDIVGLRSSPEIYLETISLKNLKRTPCAVADDKGNSILIENMQDFKALEDTLRNFAANCGGLAFVVGYPLKIEQLMPLAAENSISLCESIGYDLNLIKEGKMTFKKFCLKNELKLLDYGVILKCNTITKKGFESGQYIIKNDDVTYRVYFKNENIVLKKNTEIILTAPDSIILFDMINLNAINNFEQNENKKIAILGKKAIPIWRTAKGRRLFNPKTLGLNFKQVLL